MKKPFYLVLSFTFLAASTVSFTQQKSYAQVPKSASSTAQPASLQTTESQKNASVIEGVWLTQKSEKNAKIQISRCTDDKTKFCGKIVWLESPTHEDGSPKVDRNNPDTSKQDRPLVGLNLLTNFDEIEKNKFWGNGKIYNPEDGDIYSCEITYLVKDNIEKLEVHGYVGISLFGKTQTWVRSSLN